MVQISRIMIPTKDRPVELTRAVDSIIKHLQHHDRKCAIFISDQSATPKIAQNEIVKACEASKTRLFYFTRHNLIDFMDRLSLRSGVDSEILNFALCSNSPTSFGANRNICSLLNAGHVVSSFDDDVICSPKRAFTKLQADCDVSVSYEAPWRVMCFRNADELQQNLFDHEPCFLDLHQRFLGMAVADLIGSESLDIALAKRSVVCTESGVYGELGMRNPLSNFLRKQFRDENRSRSYAWADAHLSPSFAIRQAEDAVISAGPHLFTTAFGLDNRKANAPFIPHDRGEDKLFAMINLLLGNITVSVPQSFAHIPKVRSVNNRDISKLKLSNVLVFLLLPLLASSGRQVESLNSISEYLLSMASASSTVFNSLLCDLHANYIILQVLDIKSAIAEFPNSAYTVKELFDRQLSLCRLHSSWTPQLIAESSGFQDGSIGLQKYLHILGRLFGAWAVLHQEAMNMDVQCS